MATVHQILDTKGESKNYSLAGSDSVLKALQLMDQVAISAVMVTEGDKIVGIFTERDYSRKVEVKGLTAKETKLNDVMTEQMMTVSRETSVEQCMELMRQYHIRHLPVIEDEKMIGMVSMRDVVDTLLDTRESEIIGLENYILSSGFAL